MWRYFVRVKIYSSQHRQGILGIESKARQQVKIQRAADKKVRKDNRGKVYARYDMYA